MAASFEERILAERKRVHTTVFDVAYSPCGNYFAACNNFGDIAIFSLSSALASDARPESRKPIFTFKAHGGPIYSLLSTQTFLISGGSTEITGWRWSEILEMTSVTSWTLKPPASSVLGFPETNALVYSEQDDTLLSGCGDNNIYAWDLETGSCKNTIKGHTDYIQCLALRPLNHQCVSGSEDGTVRFWDYRTVGGMVNMIEPHKKENLKRPQFGPWISSVAVDENEEWMVCGGGPKLSVWHLRSMTCTSVLDTPKSCQQTAVFHDDMILSAGTEPSVYQWQVNGELRSRVPCTASSVYALRVNETSPDKKILMVGGSSADIDTYINLGYKAFSFRFS